MKDEFCWGLENNGQFSVKSATWVAHELPYPPEQWKFKWIWKVDVPPKLKLFLWQLLNQGLPVRSNLHYRCSDVSENCQLCAHPSETEDHLFLTCPVMKDFWNNNKTISWLETRTTQVNIKQTINYIY